MATTSIDPFNKSANSHRRVDSDNDSAISMSLDNAAVEKRRFSVIKGGISYDPNPRYRNWKSHLNEAILFALPSFARRGLKNQPSRAEKKTRIKTLDGLRGIASLLILNDRFTANYDRLFRPNQIAFDNQSPLQWSVVRVLWSGATMIDISFVIAGYVLSYKALRYMHSSNSSDAQRHLASSTLRRGVRLYVPTVLALLLTGILSWIGAFDQARKVFNHQNNILGLSEQSPPRFTKFSKQMEHTSLYTLKLFDIWHETDEHLHAGSYDLYSWVIPATYRNSMIIFASLMAVSRLRTKYRLFSTMILIAFALYSHNRNIVLFLLGMFFADVDQLRFATFRCISYSSYYHETSSKMLTVISPRSPLYPAMFMAGLLICSGPALNTEYDYIYSRVHNLIPTSIPAPVEWTRALGSVLIVWATANSIYLKPLFENRLIQYLGRISFSLFLVQGSIIKMILHANLPVISNKLEDDGLELNLTKRQMVTVWFLGLLMCLPLSIWVADIYWRAVDAPCIKFAKWLEDQVSETDEVGSASPKRWQ